MSFSVLGNLFQESNFSAHWIYLRFFGYSSNFWPVFLSNPISVCHECFDNSIVVIKEDN